jgi:hypothetical protein
VSDTKPSEPLENLTFTLTKAQAYAILTASLNFENELKELKKSGNLGVAWRLLWDDWERGNKRMHDQYFDQCYAFNESK